MDKLTNKQYKSYNYRSRYSSTPYYYDKETRREIFGIGEAFNKNIPYVTYKVQQGDTLDSLALTYYDDSTMFWLISFMNNISDCFINLSEHFTYLKIPTVTSIEFKNER